ncbi:MAG: RluA family pseudouridine synthase [Ferruginibacter sp.]
MKVDIIFENDHFIAVNKASGMLTIPDRHDDTIPSLQKILNEKYGRIFTVHRLDKDTSGIILFAKDEVTHKYLSQLFEERKIEKYYQAIVHGTPASPIGTVDAPITENTVTRGTMLVHRRGKPSITDYEVIESFGNYSLMQFHIHTGRTHQIRVHMKHIGHPVACDIIYGDGKPFLLSSIKKKFKLSKNEEEERPMLNRLALHSYKLEFKDAEGNRHSLSAEHSKDIRALLQQLRKKN